jgi:ubiquinone/menaquinone biosynthesis C-methylase UbiE
MTATRAPEPAEANPRDRTDADSGIAVAGGAFGTLIYEPFLWLGERRGMRDRRRRLLADARGQVLEIGAGTGLNYAHYDPAQVEELVLAEPVAEMAARIETKLEAEARPLTARTRVALTPAERLPFDDASFDTVVSTMVLCTVTDPERALEEVRRVLRPAGRLLFCEHVLSGSGRLARWQQRLAAPWAAFAAGCRCDRDTVETIATKLELGPIRKERWRGMPAIVKPLVVGAAVA